MAISELQFSAVSCYPFGRRRQDDCSRVESIGLIETRNSAFRYSSASRLSSFLNRKNGFDKRAHGGRTRVHAIAPPAQLFRDSTGSFEEVAVDLMNGFGEPLGFPSQQNNEKMVVAVDIDEVLGSFLHAMNRFMADRYALDHEVSEYYVYEFFRVWKCSPAEADVRVHEFYKTPYFRFGVDPIPGAQSVLRNLSAFCDLSIVTSRQNVIRGHTHDWIEKHFPGVFQQIQFGNHFALSGNSRPKSEICRSLGAQVLIDDNPRYALECAEAGVKVLLFNYRNSYPWCKDCLVGSHGLVTEVCSWEEVERQLISWSTSLCS
ncbi:hypothetical protein KSP39_PZI020717 [Platanthera zijinensis]|uniref:Tac7077 n=1 Tax=Platanthera zijinensis TaxID=2320716 RepID=A0AAP0B0X6_9ASPA